MTPRPIIAMVMMMVFMTMGQAVKPLRREPAVVGEAPTPRKAGYRYAASPWCSSPWP